VWQVLIGAIVGGAFTLLGGVVGQVRQDRREQLGAAQLLMYEMLLNAHAMEKYLERFGDDPHDVEAHEGAARDMVVHSSTASWRQYSSRLISLFDYEFREVLVATYAALISNETAPGSHRHATWDAIDVLNLAREQLEPHARPTWIDRYVWRF
jgi:hypothetical protein